MYAAFASELLSNARGTVAGTPAPLCRLQNYANMRRFMSAKIVSLPECGVGCIFFFFCSRRSTRGARLAARMCKLQSVRRSVAAWRDATACESAAERECNWQLSQSTFSAGFFWYNKHRRTDAKRRRRRRDYIYSICYNPKCCSSSCSAVHSKCI